MTDRPEVFAKEWRSCLRAQYQRVVQQGETQNERSLLRVLTKLDFSETELEELRMAAIQGAPAEIAHSTPNLAGIRAETQASAAHAASVNDDQPINSKTRDEMDEIDPVADDADEPDDDLTLHNEAVDDIPESPQLSLFD